MVKLRGKAWKHNWKQITFKIFISNVIIIISSSKTESFVEIEILFSRETCKNEIDSKKYIYCKLLGN